MEVREDTTGKFKLRDYAVLAPFPTPSAHKNTKNSENPTQLKENGVQSSLADAAHQQGLNEIVGHFAPGPATPSSCVQTAKREGLRLNSRFSLWLMGFPNAWARLAPKNMGRVRSRSQKAKG